MTNQRIAVSLVIGLTFLLSACGNSVKQTEDGVLYQIYDDKPGETIKQGDFVALNFTEKTEEDSILYNSSDDDGRWAYKFREPSLFKGDFFTALGTLSEGDSALIKIKLDSLRIKGGRTDLARVTGKYLIYDVKITKAISRGNKNDSMFNAAIERLKSEEVQQARLNEEGKISEFVRKSRLSPAQTKSGLSYVIKQQGSGSAATLTDTVLINYTARYLSGKVFETSEESIAKQAGILNKLRKYGPVKQNFFPGSPLSGIEEALLLFPAGTKAMLIIPSKLAFKGSAYRGLKPYTPLLCDLEIVSILNPKQ